MTNSVRIQAALPLLFIILIFSSACQKAESAEIYEPTSTSKSHFPTSPPIHPSPNISYSRPAPKVQESIKLDIPAQEPTPEPAPLDFSSPPLYSDPSWRPPLYPVPLALTTFDHFFFTRPFAANDVGWPVEDYRYGGSFFEDVVHSGMDIKIPVGTPVLAAGPGKIVWSGYGLFSGRYDPDDPYGNSVMIRHSFGHNGALLYTVYAHLSRVVVERDQYIEGGELIGLSGETGITSGPHLHFEVRLDEEGNGFFSTRNPELWLVPPQGWGVLAGRVMNTGGKTVEGQLVIVRPPMGEKFWRANSYHYGYIYPDPYYQENLVVSDLPAGKYEIVINYLSRIYTREIEIYPGLVSYFSFRGRSGYTHEPPPLPGADFDPPQFP
jgi:murein DD-endopeptidase MepM/ murein hydrolase activator NlpD